ncbi:LytR cell envelope-related transcriptional attenuator [Fibrobacter sp. UWT2]|nr:LytR cell envelope-related transcriptional attenuator [Fibrobacter sp. UWT2]
MYNCRSKTFQLLFAAMAIFMALLLTSCEEEQKKAPVVKVKRTYKGDVEVLNSCGMQGAAAKMRSYLRENGFDIVSSRNDRLQNYDETVLVLRNPEWEGAKALAKALKTDNVLVVHSSRAVVDAAVYIGKDFEQIIEPEQGETDDNE